MNSPITNESIESKPESMEGRDKDRDSGSESSNTIELRSPGKPELTRAPKMVLIDDDPSYTAILGRFAALEGIELDTFNSLSELGFVSLLGNYDVAIIDYDLGALNGVEIAEYMTNLLDDMPMVLISATDRSEEIVSCPGSLRAFINKSAGFDKILETAKQCITAQAS